MKLLAVEIHSDTIFHYWIHERRVLFLHLQQIPGLRHAYHLMHQQTGGFDPLEFKEHRILL